MLLHNLNVCVASRLASNAESNGCCIDSMNDKIATYRYFNTLTDCCVFEQDTHKLSSQAKGTKSASFLTSA